MSEEKKKKSGKWEKYQVSGNALTRKNRSCPKCGAGVFLAQHKDRASCGSCGYFEKTVPKKEEAKKQE